MIVYVVEGGDYEDKHILAVCSSKEIAEKKQKKWDNKNSFQGSIIPSRFGGDGIKRYKIGEARVTEWEIE